MEITQMQEEKEMNRIDKNLTQTLIKKNEIEIKQKLNIVYLMVWTKLCGGSKVILEHISRLNNKGHNITIITYDSKPTWYPLNSSINFIQVPEQKDINKFIPECDIIVSTSWKCIYEAMKKNIAPVVYFEQGDSYLFDAPNIEEEKKEKIKRRFKMASYIYTVSSHAKNKLLKEYDVESDIIPISVDETIFYPNKLIKKKSNIEITTIGPEEFKFKNITEIIQAVSELQEEGYNIHFNWITQTEPIQNKIECIVNPPQKVIGDILRKTDIYVCASEYESFGLPTLEAMNCGATVVTTDTGGCHDFVFNEQNSLMIEKHNIKDMKAKIKILIEQPELRNKLSKAGLNTAQQYSLDNSIKKLEKYYKNIATFKLQEFKKE